MLNFSPPEELYPQGQSLPPIPTSWATAQTQPLFNEGQVSQMRQARRDHPLLYGQASSTESEHSSRLQAEVQRQLEEYTVKHRASKLWNLKGIFSLIYHKGVLENYLKLMSYHEEMIYLYLEPGSYQEEMVRNYLKPLSYREEMVPNYLKPLSYREEMVPNYLKPLSYREEMVPNYRKPLIYPEEMVLNYLEYKSQPSQQVLGQLGTHPLVLVIPHRCFKLRMVHFDKMEEYLICQRR
eukprot:s8284_g6.t1